MFRFNFKFGRGTTAGIIKVRGRDTLKVVSQPGRDWWWLVAGWALGLLLVVLFGFYLTYQANDLERVSLVADELATIPSPNGRKSLDTIIKVINGREAAYQAAQVAPAPQDPAR